MSDLVYNVTNGNFETEVLKCDKVVIVDFWAEWCGPCRALAPVLDKIAEENPDTIKVCKVNVEEEPQLAAKFNIRNIPFMCVFKDGQKVNDLVGNLPKDKILAEVNKHVG